MGAGVNALNPSEIGWAVSEEGLRCDWILDTF